MSKIWSKICVGLQLKYPFILVKFLETNYRGADKSLARPDWKNNWKAAIFRPTRRSLLPRRPGWKDNLLNFLWVACKSHSSVAVACFFLVGLRTYQHPDNDGEQWTNGCKWRGKETNVRVLSSFCSGFVTNETQVRAPWVSLLSSVVRWIRNI